MKKSFCYIFAILWSLSFALFVQAQDIDPWSDEEAAVDVENNDSESPDLSRPKIFSAVKCYGKSKNGYVVKRYLMIEYPWSKIQNATLEVRIIGPEAEKQPQFCNPAYFKSIYGKLERIDKGIFSKKTGNQRFANNIEYSRSLFHEYGLPEPEILELATITPPAGARADYFYLSLVNQDTNELETTLIFHDLTQWAVDGERLALELCGKPIYDADGKTIKEIEFKNPCKIKIWLLHDDCVVWQETFQWPGTEKDKPKKSNAERPSIDIDDDEDPRQSAKKMEDAVKEQKNDVQPDEADDDSGFDSFGDDF